MIAECIKNTSAPAHNANVYQLPHPREIIRELRARRGFTSDRALALAAGVPQPTLSRYLAGATDSMSVEVFRRLADTLEVTVSELLGEVPVSSGGRVKELAAIMRTLTDDRQRALLATGRALAQAANDDDREGT